MSTVLDNVHRRSLEALDHLVELLGLGQVVDDPLRSCCYCRIVRQITTSSDLSMAGQHHLARGVVSAVVVYDHDLEEVDAFLESVSAVVGEYEHDFQTGLVPGRRPSLERPQGFQVGTIADLNQLPTSSGSSPRT